MLPDPETAAELGRSIVADGRLKALRHRLGITRSAMAELLHTNMITYAGWERRPEVNLRSATAQRLGRFYHLATQELDMIQDLGIRPENLVPFNVVSMLLGVPREVLLQWYREERFVAVDAGILGLWVNRDEVHRLRETR